MIRFTKRSPWKVWILTLVATLALGGPLTAQTLYDGSLGTLPGSQRWTYLTDPLVGAKAVQTLTGASAMVDTTTEITNKAGYFSSVPPFIPAHPKVGVLDRVKGFTVIFDSAVMSEVHNTTNRAGFSIIVLASDLSGIELGFWEDQIWAQEDGANLFFHAESKPFNTKTRTSYRLSLHDQSYTLSANGTNVLTGRLRNYSSFGAPYNTSSFIFLGDDTSSAAANFQINSVSLEKNVAPSTLEVVGFGPNGYQLKITGPTGPVYYLEASEDLLHWTTRQTLNSFNGIATLTDGESLTLGSQFYRVRSGGNP